MFIYIIYKMFDGIVLDEWIWEYYIVRGGKMFFVVLSFFICCCVLLIGLVLCGSFYLLVLFMSIMRWLRILWYIMVFFIWYLVSLRSVWFIFLFIICKIIVGVSVSGILFIFELFDKENYCFLEEFSGIFVGKWFRF